MKRQRFKFPWDLCWGKHNIEAKKVYSCTSRGLKATSSPGRFILALEVGREKRPGDEVGVGGACESWLISGYQKQTEILQHSQAIFYRLRLLRISSVFLSSETSIPKSLMMVQTYDFWLKLTSFFFTFQYLRSKKCLYLNVIFQATLWPECDVKF